ncbi:hypothetical protein VOLCADRAFT_107054 [Volvox carteri f. nagariensis]|uniref:MI domain-containing protein n=1 Tax=Volvox carteri f. nagariensis TaxID=3068 RepID=D8UBQ2_VOLCA|nr:uncharacterized protein VOLCADRAFT_107054 [Volvox carteri f. nagariensis]EFJ42803.1 hypothetical protein VOLCADRAFT_107054 [Volvox carteri f. nagariensis]|eukprot:XP_002956063.1 hypothetical protein VOLCADRAFT_107054 [Volvox carteri f. nagariensis]
MRDEGAAISSPKPAPFLTDEQRAALDQALRDKAQEQAKARAAANHKAAAASGERKSRSAKGPGGAKKGGGGGKYTWGSLLTTGAPAAKGDVALDKGDPNYDSEEDERDVVLLRNHQAALRQEVAAYKEQVRSIVEEYFVSGSVSDVAESLEELGASHLAHYFVKRLLTTALDHKDREREMASTLLSSLYAEVIAPDQLIKGFTSLFTSLPDLVLDVPEAPELLSRFVMRAVVDDVLPPAIVSYVDPESGPACRDLRQRCEAQLAARHNAEKVLRCWGGAGTGTHFTDSKAAISSLLAEYLVARDLGEASRRLRELGLPFFHHELVKQALVAALDNPSHVDPVVALLARLSSSGEVSCSQLAKGLRRVADNLADAVLDNPAAGERFAQLVAAARTAKVFDDLEPEDMGTNAALAVFGTPAAADGASGPSSTCASNGGGGGAVASSSGGASAGGVVVAMPPGVAAFKAASLAALREYFDSQDAEEVAARLVALEEPGLHPLFVKAAVSLALDRKDRERELVSKLLVALVPEVISPEALAGGFTRLLAAADDLVLDVPDAVHLLSLFLGRVVVDELLPPAFLTQVLPSLDADGLGVAVVRSAGIMLAARHGFERLVNCWHGGALELGAVRQAIRAAIEEYGTSGDVAEVARCLRELGASSFSHEAVVAAVELAFSRYHGKATTTTQAPGANGSAQPQPKEEHESDAGAAPSDGSLEAAAGPVVELLTALAGQGVLSATQLTTGIERVRAALSEEVMDYGPSSQQVLNWITERGLREGWLAAA